jgi:outer membrane protein assembly factor BamB
MKYIEIKKISDIKRVKSFDGIVYYGSTQGIHFKNKCINDIEIQSFHVIDNDLLYYNTKGDFCIFSHNQLITFENCGFYPKSYEKNQLLLRYDNHYDKKKDEFTFKVGLFDILTLRLIIDLMSNYGFYRYIGNSYLCGRTNEIHAFSRTTGNSEWQFNLAGSRIISIIGHSAHKLVLICERHPQKSTLALNAYTGEIIWEAIGGDFFSDFSKKKDTIVHLQSGGFWLNGILLAQHSNVFREMDIHTGQIRREGILVDLDANDLALKTFTIAGDHIYFTAHYRGSFGATVVGVLDYDHLQLLWWQEVELSVAGGFGNFLINKPVVAGDNLYLLDKTNLLHLFERTEDNTAHKIGNSGLVPFENRRSFDVGLRNQNSRSDENLPF